MTALEFVRTYGLKIVPTGSRFIVDPPVADTDADYAVFTVTPMAHAEELLNNGWAAGGSPAGMGSDGFASFRNGDENIILIHDAALWMAFVAATNLAKEMNLKDKLDRVILFQTIDKLWPGTPMNKVYREVRTNVGDIEF